MADIDAPLRGGMLVVVVLVLVILCRFHGWYHVFGEGNLFTFKAVISASYQESSRRS